MYEFYNWRPYVPVAVRRHQAARELAALRKGGHTVAPVVIQGRTIARTFWGKAWCTNLECYSDYANRLPRGRSYVRSGAVIHLQIEPGAVAALVRGSELYQTTVSVAAIPKTRWKAVCRDCTGAIDSLVELLQGRLSNSVMDRICQQKTGLFPAPSQIAFACSCPDGAWMCKHVAAVLYGIGARLDDQPELLFALRQVDVGDLITEASTSLPRTRKGPASGKLLETNDLAAVFGIEMAPAVTARAPRTPRNASPPKAARTALPKPRKSSSRKPGKAALPKRGKASASKPDKGSSPRPARALSPKPGKASSSKRDKASSPRPAKASSPKPAKARRSAGRKESRRDRGAE
ncbi:MAG TPA: SWIM zinc finger family protein [Longimicrobiales bacterium]|nr:SWIM zinc finger family protein [Longimicrobiales bacterium]